IAASPTASAGTCNRAVSTSVAGPLARRAPRSSRAIPRSSTTRASSRRRWDSRSSRSSTSSAWSRRATTIQTRTRRSRPFRRSSKGELMSLFTIESLSAVLAIVSSTTLAVAILRQRPLRPFHLCFSGGMLAFAAEAIAALMLAPHGLWKADILFWSWFLGLAMLVTPLLWMVFVVSFLSDGDHHRPSLRSRLILIGTFILALASIVVLARRPTIALLRIDGAFPAMVLGAAIVGFLGVYLLAVGVLAWLLRRVAVAEPVFWGSLLLFVSGLILAILLLSEDLRWRVKRFIALHFYRTKYDYREQWQSFTARLGALLTVEHSAPQVAQAIVEAVGATDAALYLGAADGRFRCAASVGTIAPLSTIDADAPLLALFRRERRPFVVGSEAVPGSEEIGR